MKKVVSATLAGALAVGMVPAMALADDAVELQAETENQAVANGSIIAFEGGLADGAEFVSGAAVTKLVPTAVAAEITGKEYNVVKVEYVKIAATGAPNSGDYTVDGKQFKLDGSWKTNPTLSVGKWAVRATADVDGNGTGDVVVKDCAVFNIVAGSMNGVEIYEVGEKAEDLSDTTVVFKDGNFEFGAKNSKGKLNLKVGGKALAINTDYTVKIFNEANTAEVTPKFAGTYNVVITGVGAYAGVEKTLKLTVEPFDIAKANIVINDIKFGAAPAISTIDGVKFSSHALKTELEIASLSAPITKAGAYSAVIDLNAATKANKDYAASIINTQSVDFAVVSGTATLAVANGNPLNVDRSSDTYKATDEFDPSEVVVTADGVELTADKYEFVVTRTDVDPDAPASIADLTDKSKYGTYKVSVKIKPEAVGYAYAGTKDVGTFTITNGAVDAATVAYNYGGVLLPAAGKEFTYDGKDVLDALEIVVKTDKGVLVPASDYTVVLEKKDALSNWVEVSEAADAGEYKVTLKSGKYVLDAAHGLTFEILQAPVRAVIGDQITQGAYATGNNFVYTGEAIDPIDAFYQLESVGGAVKVVNGKPVVVDVPAAGYKVTITAFTPEGPNAKPVLKKDLPTEFKAAGTYTFSLVDTDTAAASDNYAVEDIVTATLNITAMDVYPDVASDAWYADEVLAVSQAKWITGYSNGLFGPNDGMKRGDLALVLARYAGMPTPAGTPDEGENGAITDSTIDIDFSDVKGNEYYAWAVEAMAEAGVMTGYTDGSGAFGAKDLVTRQQLATILARFDEAGLGDVSILASALDAYADADEVAGWATAGVEWAVENGIMGVNTAFLNPGDVVTRAEVAAMLVRYAAL